MNFIFEIILAIDVCILSAIVIIIERFFIKGDSK